MNRGHARFARNLRLACLALTFTLTTPTDVLKETLEDITGEAGGVLLGGVVAALKPSLLLGCDDSHMQVARGCEA